MEEALKNDYVGRHIQLTDLHTVLLSNECGCGLSRVIFRLADIQMQTSFCGSGQVFDQSATKLREDLEEQITWVLLGVPGDNDFADVLSREKIPCFAPRWAQISVAHKSTADMERIAKLIFLLAPDFECVGLRLILPWGHPAHYVCQPHDDPEGFSPETHPKAALWDVWLSYFQPRPDDQFHRQHIRPLS